MDSLTEEDKKQSNAKVKKWVGDYAEKFDELTVHDSPMKNNLMSDEETVRESAIQDLIVELQSDEESES